MAMLVPLAPYGAAAVACVSSAVGQMLGARTPPQVQTNTATGSFKFVLWIGQEDDDFLAICDFVEEGGEDAWGDLACCDCKDPYLTAAIWNFPLLRPRGPKERWSLPFPPVITDEAVPLYADDRFVKYKTVKLRGYNFLVTVSREGLKFAHSTILSALPGYEAKVRAAVKKWREDDIFDRILKLRVFAWSTRRLFVTQQGNLERENVPFDAATFWPTPAWAAVEAFALAHWPDRSSHVSPPPWVVAKGHGVLLEGAYGTGKSYLVHRLADRYRALVVDFDSKSRQHWHLLEREVVEARSRVVCVFEECDKMSFADGAGVTGPAPSSHFTLVQASNEHTTVGSVLAMVDRMLMNPNVLLVALVNDARRLHPAFKRPGRFADKVITVEALDLPTILRILSGWFSSDIAQGAGFTAEIVEQITRRFPASSSITIAEFTEFFRQHCGDTYCDAFTFLHGTPFERTLGDWLASHRENREQTAAAAPERAPDVMLATDRVECPHTSPVLDAQLGRATWQPKRMRAAVRHNSRRGTRISPPRRVTPQLAVLVVAGLALFYQCLDKNDIMGRFVITLVIMIGSAYFNGARLVWE